MCNELIVYDEYFSLISMTHCTLNQDVYTKNLLIFLCSKLTSEMFFPSYFFFLSVNVHIYQFITTNHISILVYGLRRPSFAWKIDRGISVIDNSLYTFNSFNDGKKMYSFALNWIAIHLAQIVRSDSWLKQAQISWNNYLKLTHEISLESLHWNDVGLSCEILYGVSFYRFRSGSKTNAQKKGAWNSWRAWAAVASTIMRGRCAVFKWICHPVAWTMGLVFRTLLPMAMAGLRFIHMAMVHFSADMGWIQCCSTGQVKDFYVCITFNKLQLISV